MRIGKQIAGVIAMAALGLAGCGGATDGDDGGQRNGVGLCADCEVPGAPKPTPAEDAGADRVEEPVTTPGPTPPLPTPTAGGGIAIRHGAISPPSSGSSGSTGGGGGLEIDPDTLYVVLRSRQPLCAAPYAAIGCGEWRVAFSIPPELVEPGLLMLSDPRLNAHSSASGEDRGGGDCSWGGGSFVEGSVEIVSVGAESVELRLADTWTFDFDANGSHTVARCP